MTDDGLTRENGQPARVIRDFDVPVARGLATDEVLMGTTSLHLYTYAGAAIVGRYQDLEANVDVEWCRENDVEVSRRLTGGGAILMTPDQLGIALTLNRERYDLPRDNAALFEHFGNAITSALGEFGIDASFIPKNDVIADGRKIAGLGLWERTGEVQFHCSLLLDVDVETMLRALHISEEKLSDKQISSFEDRLTSVREHVDATVEEVADAIQRDFEDTLGVEFETGTLDEDEREERDSLAAERYGTDEWLHRVEADATERSVEHKTDGGLLRVYVATEDDVISHARLTGDFFARQETVNAIEAAVKWTPADEAEIESALAEAPDIEGVSDEELARVIYAASIGAESVEVTDA